MAKKVPVKRHVVDIFRLPKTTTIADRGQRESAAVEVASEILCSIEWLSGDELSVARQLFAEARLRVRMHGDPDWELTPSDYLVRDPQGTRLDIGFVQDPEGTDFEYTLLCGEEIAAA
jgi:hypothetical protein